MLGLVKGDASSVLCPVSSDELLAKKEKGVGLQPAEEQLWKHPNNLFLSTEMAMGGGSSIRDLLC